jgi:hypothetical protein
MEMRTVTAFEARQAAGRTFGGNVVKLSSQPRGAIGAGLFLLVSLFLLAAGGLPSAPGGDGAGPAATGAFLLDPSVSPVRG